MLSFNEFCNLKEYEMLCEMPNLTKHKYPKLPCNIFISKKVPQHGPRIKFQRNHNPNVQMHFLSSMSISNDPEIFGPVGDLTTKNIKFKSIYY